jgi:hypothetical protein
LARFLLARKAHAKLIMRLYDVCMGMR